jgi:hypothetical protein
MPKQYFQRNLLLFTAFFGSGTTGDFDEQGRKAIQMIARYVDESKKRA